eukprot:2755787-Ditylum_brightwellii.AAC.1
MSECAESLQAISPGNPLLKKTATVSIGLSNKNTIFSSVLSCYCKAVNAPYTGHGLDCSKVQPLDLEFFHCCLLSGSNKVEAMVLMKNDQIKAQQVWTDEWEAEAECVLEQQRCDHDYFSQL